MDPACFDAHFTYLDTAKSGKPLETGVRMHVAHGTKEVLGRVLLADRREKLMPGESCYVQVRLEEPLPVSLGDRFIVRTYSPVFVAGGGQILQAHPRASSNLNEERVVLDALVVGDRQKAAHLLLEQRETPLQAEDLAWKFGIDAESARLLLEAEKDAKSARLIGGTWYVSPSALRHCISVIEAKLLEFHAVDRTKPGLPKEELRQKCFTAMDPACFDALIDEAILAKAAVVAGGLVGHPTAQGAAQQVERDAADALLALLSSYALTPPPLSELAAEAKVDIALARRALARLREEGSVYRVSSELFYENAAVEACRKAIAEKLRSGGEGTIAGLKDAMGGISRKYAVPLLEAFDAEGFTVRDGDARKLRE